MTRNVANRLLTDLPEHEAAAIFERLRPVRLIQREVLKAADQPSDRLLFVESGCILVNATGYGSGVTLACVGSEGMIGAPLVLGADENAYAFVVAIPGNAFEASVKQFVSDRGSYPTLLRAALRFNQDLLRQFAETALAAARLQIRARLARLLAMLWQRGAPDKIVITHDELCRYLGCRRPGVTVALHELEGAHVVTAIRGGILVTNPAGLSLEAQGIPTTTADDVRTADQSPSRTSVLRRSVRLRI